MKRLLILPLLLMSAMASAHNWPAWMMNGHSGVGYVHQGAYCFNPTNCTTNRMREAARAILTATYCNSNNVCAPAQGTVHEIHRAKYNNGIFQKEVHYLFIMVKDWPEVGKDYFSMQGSHNGGSHCPDHNYQYNLYD